MKPFIFLALTCFSSLYCLSIYEAFLTYSVLKAVQYSLFTTFLITIIFIGIIIIATDNNGKK